MTEEFTDSVCCMFLFSQENRFLLELILFT